MSENARIKAREIICLQTNLFYHSSARRWVQLGACGVVRVAGKVMRGGWEQFWDSQLLHVFCSK